MIDSTTPVIATDLATLRVQPLPTRLASSCERAASQVSRRPQAPRPKITFSLRWLTLQQSRRHRTELAETEKWIWPAQLLELWNLVDDPSLWPL